MDAKKKTSKTEETATVPQAEAKSTAKKRPVKVIMIEDISVPIFAHEREANGVVRVNHSWTVQRNYKDPSGQWKRTPWFGPDDCGKVVSAIQQAAEWIHDQAEQDAQ